MVPKIFPTLSTPPGPTPKNMKLTRRRIRWLIKRRNGGMSSKSIARGLKISKRRVNQVWRMYMDSGEIPVIGENIGRPKREITERERRIVLEANKKYKLGARRLEPIIERLWNPYTT